MIGSSQPVVAMVGDDVILPCHIDPPVNMTKSHISWYRNDLKPPYVHVLKDGYVHFWPDQNPSFNQRTSLFDDQLSRGNISLKLSRVELSDQGIYRCSVPVLHISSLIKLLVGKILCSTQMEKT